MKRLFRKLDSWPITIAAFCLMGVVWYAPGYLSIAQGNLWPVVSPIVLSQSTPTGPPPHRHTWSGASDKYLDCDYILGSVQWFNGSIDGRAQEVTAYFLDAPEIRDVGTLEWDALVIYLDPYEVLNNSYAYVWHDCGQPWPVRTLFYNSAETRLLGPSTETTE